MTSSSKSSKVDYYSVDIKGRFTGSKVEQAKKAVECGLKMNHKVILFNLELMTVIDSRGLGFLINLHKELSKKGGRICLTSLRPNVQSIIKTCGLHKVIQIYKSNEEAELALDCGIQIEDTGFYALVKFPKEFNLTMIKPLREELDRIIETGTNQFVIDFKDTELITSVAIGILVNLYKRLKAQDGGMYLFRPSPKLHDLLEATSLLKLIPEYNSLKEIEDKLM